MKRWLCLSALVVAALLLAAALAPRSASAQRTVDLLSGCNPVTFTFPNGTPTTTAAAGVQPAESLLAMWKFVPAEHRWMGFMAGAPAEVSDLQTVERLDVVFVCVNAVGTITMPQIGGGG